MFQQPLRLTPQCTRCGQCDRTGDHVSTASTANTSVHLASPAITDRAVWFQQPLRLTPQCTRQRIPPHQPWLKAPIFANHHRFH